MLSKRKAMRPRREGANAARVRGRIEGHPDGHGFLVPDDGGAPVYLSGAEMRQVLHGDRAEVRLTGVDARARPAGEIVRVLGRARRPIVGTLHDGPDVLVLVPEDRRIAQDLLVPRQAAGGGRAGEVVSVEISAPPTRHSPARARVIEVLGARDSPGMEVEIALRKFGLPHAFSAAALAAARAVPQAVRAADLEGRRDLRALEFVTLDGESAKDFDDAVCAHRDGRGHRLWVAIADVAHYVRHGSALDRDARERATSVYFPRRAIPMLPPELSNGICSLVAGVDRLAMVCEMALSASGAITEYDFYPAVIRSRARLTYPEAARMLAAEAPPAHLARLYAAYRALARARGERGAIDFETVETRIVFGAGGRIERIVPEPRTDAHRLIEECMLAANVCAGEFLAARGHPTLYRVHEQPAPEKVRALREFLAELGLPLGGGAKPRPQDYARLLERIRGRPDAALLQTLVLRSLPQAHYSTRNVGHFGLAFDAYVHFTSPIRRYPDLLVHRAIKACLAGRRYDAPDWEALGRHASEAERRADEASRDVESWLKCVHMREHVGGVFTGRITGVTAFGLFVTLDEYFVDGLVHVSELGRERFRFEANRHRLLGERSGRSYRLADPIRVRLVRVDVESRRMDFVPA
jgi:ribonuclease R